MAKRPLIKKLRAKPVPLAYRVDMPEESYAEPEYEEYWEEDPQYAGFAADPKTGELYDTAPAGIEEAAGPEDIADPAQVKSAIRGLLKKGVPIGLGMIAQLRMPKINPKDLPAESMVRTPLAVVDKEFAKKVMSPQREQALRAQAEHLHSIDHPKEQRPEIMQEFKKRYDSKPKSDDSFGSVLKSIDNSRITSNQAFIHNTEDLPKTFRHEGLHKVLGPKGSVRAINRTAYEHILNKEVPNDVSYNIQILLQNRGYKYRDAQAELIPWLVNIINKQISLENIPDIRKLTREQYKELQRNARELHKYKKEIQFTMIGGEKSKKEQWNRFMKNAKKAYNDVVKKAESITPEEIAEMEKVLLEASKPSTTKSKASMKNKK